MKIKKDNRLILSKIKSHYNFKSNVDFARFLGVAPNTLSNWYARNTMDLEIIITKCEQIDANWLFTGKGEMLKNEKTTALPTNNTTGIPLIPIEAFAGAATNNGYTINADTIEDLYQIPLFEGKGVDFMIYVRGSSMYPKYSNGDIVACRFIRELLFIQWNKVYVIDSKSQGAMIKRLIKSEKPEHITCRSDNKDYADFDVPLKDIQNIALVIGSIRLE